MSGRETISAGKALLRDGILNTDRQALLFALAAILLWSTAATAFKLALRQLDVLQLMAYAVSCSALVLVAIVWRLGRLHILRQYLRQNAPHFFAMGLLNPILFYLLLLQAYDLLPAQQAQTINYTWAITLALLAVPMLGHRLSARDIVAVVLGYTGVVIIATEGRVFELEFSSGQGVVYALVSTLVWALYWIANARNARDPIVSLCLNFMFATPVALLLCAVFSSLWVESWTGMAAALYVGLFEMGITFALWSTALRLASNVSRVGNLIFLSPLVSMVFIYTILGENIHPATLVGLALIVPGLLIQQTQANVSATDA